MKIIFKKISLALALLAIVGAQTSLASAAYYGGGTAGSATSTTSSTGSTSSTSSYGSGTQTGTAGTTTSSTVCGTCSTTGTSGTPTSTTGNWGYGTPTNGGTPTSPTNPGNTDPGTPTNPGNGGNGGNGGNINTQDSYGTSTPYTYEASPINGTTVTMNGMVQSNGLTEVWFEYGTTNGSFSNTFGYRKVGNGKYDITSSIDNLAAYTTYYYRLTSKNASNVYHGETRSFTTGKGYPSLRGYGQPTVETTGVKYLTPNSAVVVGKINANGGSTTYWFEYGTSSATSLWNGKTMLMSVSPDTFWYERAYGITGLTSGMTYYYRVVAQNPNGTSYGTIKTFATPTYAAYNASNNTNKGTSIKKYSGTGSSSTDTEDNLTSDENVNSGIILDSFVSKDEVSAGDEIKLTLTYRNTGDKKAKDATLKVSLPSEVEFVSSNVTPSSQMGSELKFTLGNISGNDQANIEITVKVKKTVEAGSTIAFNSFLEYYDEASKLQTVNAFNSVAVKAASALTGFAFLSGIGGNIFTLILLLLVVAAILYFIATRKKRRE